MSFILIDAHNLFFRGRHAVRGDIDLKVGMCLHVMFNAIRKCWNDFDGSHVVFAFDQRSWRKDFYAPYKRKRHDAIAAKSPDELEEDKIFYEAFDDFRQFVKEKTNCTVLDEPHLEADDLIAGWIQHHPDHNHVIISTDTDYYQLLSHNVKQYNGVTEELHTLNGIFDRNGKPVIDNKTKEPKIIPDPEWLLFMKIIRGDTSDNIFSAYPGVRVKGSKNKVGLQEAFEDRTAKGFAWNTLMLSRWVDHEGVEHRVIDDYERNRTLIDLSAQPPHIRAMLDEAIKKHAVPKTVSQVGIRLLKFCGIYDLRRVSDSVHSYADAFTAPYTA